VFNNVWLFAFTRETPEGVADLPSIGVNPKDFTPVDKLVFHQHLTAASTPAGHQ
jgi:hypothetical protein